MLPVMPTRRWQAEVLQELRSHGDQLRSHGEELRNHGEELRAAVERLDDTIHWLGEQNRSFMRDLKASVDRNTEVTDRCVETLAGLTVRDAALEARIADQTEQIGAQTSAILALIDEIRSSGSR